MPETKSVWHQLDVADVLQRLDCDPACGLSPDESAKRLAQTGLNVLTNSAIRKPLSILWDQVVEPMVLLLILAAGISFAIGEVTDAIVILVIVLMNTVLGFIQDYRAEKAMAALIELTIPMVSVRRRGEVSEIPAHQLVQGDVMLLEAGNRVPADGRLLESHRLRISEAALTGESAPIEKQPGVLGSERLVLGDQTNMTFMGTDVSAGRAEAIVTETGMRTELGQIAGMMQSIKVERTPLQKRLARLGVWLALAAIALVTIIIIVGLSRGQDLTLLFMTALSMAVAAVPEGLPAVATVALALGARRMLKRHALIRKLAAVETLGSVSVICCDKTGTLTENRMRVTTFAFPDVECEDPALAIETGNGLWMFTSLALCNDASLANALGDPTELALLETVPRAGCQQAELLEALPRIAEFPFDSDRKRMTTVHQAAADRSPFVSGEFVAFTKGAVDTVIECCSQVQIDGEPVALTVERREHLLATNDRLAGEGKRVLGIAYRLHQGAPDEMALVETESDLCFIGMVAMIDPPRAEVKEAVARCRAAGIRPIMITGDHPLTAKAIASQLDIAGNDGRVVTGQELMTTTDTQLDQLVRETSVFARVSPAHKLRIIRSLKRHNEVVAMTGDGVNDAPSLKEADIGVAMGITGTDVAKEASDMVLLDDHFSTIVNAVEEGRMVYDNIRKFLRYTMTSNAGEIWVMLLAPLLGMPLPLLPLQILWINLVTDGLPGLALSVEQAERNIMLRGPRPQSESIFNGSMVRQFLLMGLLMGAVPLWLGHRFWLANPTASYDPSWGTIVFTVLTLSQMGQALAVRSSRDSLFQLGLFSNKPLLGAVGLTFLLQLAAIYNPWCQTILHTSPLSLSELGACIAASSVVFWAVEGEKWLKRRFQ